MTRLGNSPLIDLQVVVLAWLSQRRWLEANMQGTADIRMRLLDNADSNDVRTVSLRAIAQFAGLNIATEQSPPLCVPKFLWRIRNSGKNTTFEENPCP